MWLLDICALFQGCLVYRGLSKSRSRRDTSSSAARAASEVTIGPTTGKMEKKGLSKTICHHTNRRMYVGWDHHIELVEVLRVHSDLLRA